MGILPDIVDGKLVEPPEWKQFRVKRKPGKNEITPERRAKFKENFEKVKAARLEKELKEVEQKEGELNNLDRKEVTEDFSDSPHADREPLKEDD